MTSSRLMRTLVFLAALFAMSLASAAPNHTVTLSVPVDISAMPYVNAFSVQCRLTYPQNTTITQDISGAAFQRYDRALQGGEFHGVIPITITAADGPAPNGYHCALYVTPSDGSGAFKPLPAVAGHPPSEHQTAPGTVPVTDIDGSFAASPQGERMIRPLRLGPAIKQPPGQLQHR